MINLKEIPNFTDMNREQIEAYQKELFEYAALCFGPDVAGSIQNSFFKLVEDGVIEHEDLPQVMLGLSAEIDSLRTKLSWFIAQITALIGGVDHLLKKERSEA